MKRFLTCLAATLGLAVPQGHAQTMPDIDEIVQVRVLPGWRETDRHVAALDFRLAPGWKTYWRTPGEAGIPPQFNWSGSRNLSAVTPIWPAPKVSVQYGLRSIGYENRLVLPLAISPRRDGQPISLNANVEIGVCADVCIPVSLSLRAVLPTNRDRASTPVIKAAIAKHPASAQKGRVRKATCEIWPTADGMYVTTRITMPRLGANEVTLIETNDPSIFVTAEPTSRHGDMLLTGATLIKPDAKPFALSRADFRFTILSDSKAVEIQGCTAR